jgi:hypothetical protein
MDAFVKRICHQQEEIQENFSIEFALFPSIR